jgi:(S)-sulfolactate dehydrogenase
MDILITEEVDGAPPAARGDPPHRQGSCAMTDEARLLETIRDAGTIMVRNQTRLTAHLLSAASNLIAIGRVGVGLDNIDVPPIGTRGRCHSR